MKKIYLSILILGFSVFILGYYIIKPFPHGETIVQNEIWTEESKNNPMAVENTAGIEQESLINPAREIVADNLSVPWEMAFLPDGSILLTERNGTLKKLGNAGFEIQVPDVAPIGEGGLLGLALHPNYQENNWIYLYHTAREDGRIKNLIERYRLNDNRLEDKKVIVDNIVGSNNHDGGRIKFGPDGFLYITTGDAQNSSSAQDVNSLAGKILRVKDDGSIPEDNPFGNAVYSYGHRNVQGITWDSEGRLWATEHGRSGVLSGYDELNLIKKGANYGWPDIQGDESRSGMETPVINSGPSETWAPSGMAYHDGSIFFAGLRGESLYEYEIRSNGFATHFKGEFGRLRNVVAGKNNDLYILTNNTDGRGRPKEGDDKLIKIFYDSLK